MGIMSSGETETKTRNSLQNYGSFRKSQEDDKPYSENSYPWEIFAMSSRVGTIFITDPLKEKLMSKLQVKSLLQK